MKKSLVTTTVYYHNGTGPIVFADAIDNGETKRDGTTVRKQILDKDTVEAVGTINGGNPTKFVIPYHAVIFATVATEESENLTPAEDAFCK